MLFHIILEHQPELCFAWKEYSGEVKNWQDSIGERAKKLGIKIHGAYVCIIELTFYFILEADRCQNAFGIL
jgi:hypothetical protein